MATYHLRHDANSRRSVCGKSAFGTFLADNPRNVCCANCARKMPHLPYDILSAIDPDGTLSEWAVYSDADNATR